MDLFELKKGECVFMKLISKFLSFMSSKGFILYYINVEFEDESGVWYCFPVYGKDRVHAIRTAQILCNTPPKAFMIVDEGWEIISHRTGSKKNGVK